MHLDKNQLAKKFGETYSFADFMDLIRVLRGPEGCPWDRAQTHASIRGNFIEETYEVLEAIDLGDLALLREELGDVLLQIGLHIEMEAEQGRMTADEVITELCRKLITRHPHVFGGALADSTEQALENWEDVKRETKGHSTHTQSLRSVPAAFPALMRAQKIQKRARKAGFDWPDAGGALDKLEEELAELRAAVKAGDAAQIGEELGDLLFSAVNAARLLERDAEEALTEACLKFVDRFEAMELEAERRGTPLSGLTLEEMDRLWDEAKRATRQR
ncbi:MAG: nucleoside triphosphate pyrophosphohydrolase [Clostridiales bacterium]|nr:nucleoside triphosphate pyrophosphohydrolase [Clostridiales bacterium]